MQRLREPEYESEKAAGDSDRRGEADAGGSEEGDLDKGVAAGGAAANELDKVDEVDHNENIFAGPVEPEGVVSIGR